MCNYVNGVCNLKMHVLKLNYIFSDASYVFVLINGKYFSHERLLDQDF